MQLIRFLAVLGVAALAWRALRAWGGAVRGGIIATAAGALAETRATHGDVTGMQKARQEAMQARRVGAWSAARAVGWSAALVAPLLVRDASPLYAAASILWMPSLATLLLRTVR